MAIRLSLDLDVFETNLLRLTRELAECSPHDTAKIIPVTKYLEPADCQQLRAADHGPFGENRADDLVAKAGSSPDSSAWHFVGHLQRNKIAKVVPRVSLLHSLDNEQLAAALDRWLVSRSWPAFDCLVQVNVAGESAKGGLRLDGAHQEIATWAERFPRLRLRGLMTMAPHVAAEECRVVFHQLRALRDAIRADLPAELGARFTELSMGMSNDYRIAAEEGATLIRLGRILFEAPAPETR